ncbi:hypothetical protein [Pseudolabrys taiwanensis]|uniref:hypothetical protein n=1 Tax=Pseudolabrys taiwanensis TaxID=331696 RepID=UPI0013B467FA|nr:hypothetical protein [Pseudolabrys taiwanensis]
MRVKDIGLQMIMPKTGTSQEQQTPPQQQANARGRDDTPELKVPPAQGLGKFVDKSV